MSLPMWYKNKLIYNGRKGPFELVYENLIDIYENMTALKKYKSSKAVLECIEAMEVCRGGSGLDLSRYLQSKNQIFEFAHYLNLAIKIYEKEFPDRAQEFKEELWNFHKNLLEIAQTLD